DTDTDNGTGEPLADVHDISEARDWSDDYIDEQLAEHDDRGDGDEIRPAPTPMSKFRHGSLGLTLGAAMTGLGNVLEPRKKEEAPVVVDYDEHDQSSERVELHLDHKDPSASVVIIHKWVDDHKRDREE